MPQARPKSLKQKTLMYASASIQYIAEEILSTWLYRQSDSSQKRWKPARRKRIRQRTTVTEGLPMSDQKDRDHTVTVEDDEIHIVISNDRVSLAKEKRGSVSI